MDRALLDRRSSNKRRARDARGVCVLVFDQLGHASARRNVTEYVTAATEPVRPVPVAKAIRVLDRDVEHLSHIERLAADRLEDIRGRRLLLVGLTVHVQ